MGVMCKVCFADRIAFYIVRSVTITLRWLKEISATLLLENAVLSAFVTMYKGKQRKKSQNILTGMGIFKILGSF